MDMRNSLYGRVSTKTEMVLASETEDSKRDESLKKAATNWLSIMLTSYVEVH